MPVKLIQTKLINRRQTKVNLAAKAIILPRDVTSRFSILEDNFPRNRILEVFNPRNFFVEDLSPRCGKFEESYPRRLKSSHKYLEE